MHQFLLIWIGVVGKGGLGREVGKAEEKKLRDRVWSEYDIHNELPTIDQYSVDSGSNIRLLL